MHSPVGSVTLTVGIPPQTTCINLNDQCSGNSQEIRSYTINLPSGGTFPGTLTYRAHEKPGNIRIRINGGSWQSFNVNQTPNDLSYVTIQIGPYAFNSGNNNVEFASGEGYICFRELCIGNAGVRIGIAEEPTTDSPELTVSPNPNNGQFEVQFYVESGRRAVLSISDLQGREVWQKNLKGSGEQRESIQLPVHATGTFIVLLRKEATGKTSKAEFKKVIVVR